MDVVNKMAWFATALTILAWAFVPKIGFANVVMFPSVPVVNVSYLPPSKSSVDRDHRAAPITKPPSVEGGLK